MKVFRVSGTGDFTHILLSPSPSQGVRTIVPFEGGKAVRGQGTDGTSVFPVLSKLPGAGAAAAWSWLPGGRVARQPRSAPALPGALPTPPWGAEPVGALCRKAWLLLCEAGWDGELRMRADVQLSLKHLLEAQEPSGREFHTAAPGVRNGKGCQWPARTRIKSGPLCARAGHGNSKV